jgi:hypothetical protein
MPVLIRIFKDDVFYRKPCPCGAAEKAVLAKVYKGESK